MIVTIFLNVIYGIISFFLSLIPTGGSFPTEWTSGVYTIWSYVNSFSFIVPVQTLVWCLGLAMTFHLFIFGWKFMHWIYSIVRGTKIH